MAGTAHDVAVSQVHNKNRRSMFTNASEGSWYRGSLKDLSRAASLQIDR